MIVLTKTRNFIRCSDVLALYFSLEPPETSIGVLPDLTGSEPNLLLAWSCCFPIIFPATSAFISDGAVSRDARDCTSTGRKSELGGGPRFRFLPNRSCCLTVLVFDDALIFRLAIFLAVIARPNAMKQPNNKPAKNNPPGRPYRKASSLVSLPAHGFSPSPWYALIAGL